MRSDYYVNTQRGRVVEIVTWGKLPFEFAHFTDPELADAMLSAATAPYRHDRSRLARGIHMQRTNSAAPTSRKFAVWDGQAARAYGGTADVVAYAREHGTPVQVIWPHGAERD